MDFSALEKKYDKDNLKKILQDFSKQIEKAYKHIDESPSKFSGKVNKVLLCGMGGSSLPADMINNLAYHSVEISICRHYDIPGWVDENTLVFVSSYSGNTEETLDSIKVAYRKGASTIGITHYHVVK